MTQKVLLGDEAIALGAIDAGIHAAYAYPGTPSTEILEYVLAHKQKHGKPHAAWCSNEKTSYEEALGVSFAGRRATACAWHALVPTWFSLRAKSSSSTCSPISLDSRPARC